MNMQYISNINICLYNKTFFYYVAKRLKIYVTAGKFESVFTENSQRTGCIKISVFRVLAYNFDHNLYLQFLADRV